MTLFVIIWLASSFVSSGLAYAYMQREWPKCADNDRVLDTTLSVFFALTFGPLGAILLFFATEFAWYGWLRPGRRQ